MKARQAMLCAALALMLIGRAATASGIMFPEDRKLPPLAIKSHRVSARVEGNLATTRLTQEFLNSTDRRLEATYVFPLPREAALSEFAMYVNGKRQSGEVVEAGRARQIYEDIVRRLRDPGLLEYLDSGLLRMRVFPIEPRSVTEVEVTYTHPLPFESGVYEYTFPLKTGQRASKVLEDLTVSVEIASEHAIASVYSPTHEVGVTRKDDRHAVAGFEQAGARLATDFTLFYALSREDFGLSLLTHRREGEPGYFALMLAPRVEIEQEKVMPKDVCLLIDTSGSMKQQDRIASAREAARFCLHSLNPGDRFALITFSTGVEVYGEGLTEATPEAVKEAVAYVEKLEARGGTALCEAALTALSLAPEADRPYLTVLATDGKPTVGPRRPDEIVAKVEEANRANVRIFTFGIAEDLSVELLDRIAAATRAYSEYVAPGREIEARIAALFRKVSNPVLANLELDYGEVQVRDVYPRELPDLFRGSQVVAFGRYTGSGEVAVELEGLLRGERRTFAYDARFPEVEAGHAFLPQIWARRKIGYLLDQIRLHGQTEELKEEVVRLSTEYGIATPYTSYLVLEDEEAYRRHGIVRGQALSRLQAEGMSLGAAPAMPGEAREREALGEELAQQRMVLGSGGAPTAEAIALSKAVRGWREADAVGPGAVEGTLRRVAGRRFVVLGGVYVDAGFTEEMALLKVKWGSDAYFNVLDALPELRPCLALGERVVVVVEGKALLVGDEGAEQMSAESIRRFFGK